MHGIVSIRPNSWQTPYEFWRIAMTHILLRGNFYAEKVIYRSRVGGFNSAKSCMDARVVSGGGIVYRYYKNGADLVTYAQDEIFHVRGLSVDGVVELVGSRASEKFYRRVDPHGDTASLFTNGVRPSGVLQSEKPLAKGLRTASRRFHEPLRRLRQQPEAYDFGRRFNLAANVNDG